MISAPDQKSNPHDSSPVHLRDAVRAAVIALRIFGRDNGLQILSLPPLLPSVTIGSIICRSRDLFGFVYSGLFDVISIHDPTRVSMVGLRRVIRITSISR